MLEGECWSVIGVPSSEVSAAASAAGGVLAAAPAAFADPEQAPSAPGSAAVADAAEALPGSAVDALPGGAAPALVLPDGLGDVVPPGLALPGPNDVPGSSELGSSGPLADPADVAAALDPSVTAADLPGRWYMLSDIPQPYTWHCSESTWWDITASDRGLEIVNTCRGWEEQDVVTKGWAAVSDPQRLRLSFPDTPIFGDAQVFADEAKSDNFVIRAAAPDGSWFIAGDEDGTAATLFATTPALDEGQWKIAHDAAVELGIQPCLMFISPTDGGAPADPPAVLCTWV
ncbi:lipocalin family protein [Corynebacterium sp. 335C]